ncbi:MAG TPA: (d)CMP kinase, partial [Acidimicrobiales bacterium]|nr:(d)CMP kinase [Acidimicrobiales bacterium]
VFLTASHEARSDRRAKEVTDLSYDTVAADIARRDHADSTRVSDPLQAADDAVVIDTTGLGIEEVVAAVLGHLDGLPAPGSAP